MWGKMEDNLLQVGNVLSSMLHRLTETYSVGLRGTEVPRLFNFLLGGTQFGGGKELCKDHDLLRAFLAEHTIGTGTRPSSLSFDPMDLLGQLSRMSSRWTSTAIVSFIVKYCYY